MALPASGTISSGQVRSELIASGEISLGQASVRALAAKPSGKISLSDLYGKQNRLYGNAGYVFTPSYSYSKLVTGLYAGYGLPGDWTAAVYGSCIEPYSGVYGAYNLWLGCPITPTGSSITITEVVDNSGAFYLDQTRISDMAVGGWGTHTLATIPNQTIFVSINVVGSSKYNGTAMRIMNADGSVCKKTDTTWVSQ